MKAKRFQSALAVCLAAVFTVSIILPEIVSAEVRPVDSQIPSLPEGSPADRFIQSQLNADQRIDVRNSLLSAENQDPAIAFSSDLSYPGMDVYLNPDGTVSRTDYLDSGTGRLTVQDFYYSNTGYFTVVGDRITNGSVQKRVMFTASGAKFREYHFNSDNTLEWVYFFDETTGIQFSQEWYQSGAFVKSRSLLDRSGHKTREEVYADNSESLAEISSFDAVTGQRLQKQGFDAAGRLIAVTDYDAQGQESRIRAFDAQGLQTSDKRFLYGTVAGVGWKQADEYDSQQRLIRTERYQNARRLYQETIDPATGKATEKNWFYASTAGEQLWRRIVCDAQGLALSLTEYDRSGALVKDRIDVSYLDTTDRSLAGMEALQDASPSGLLPDNPDDTAFIYHEGTQQEWAKIYAYTQASSYEQAVIGIDFIKAGQLQRAGTLLNFFYGQWRKELDAGSAFSGFYTLYNIDPVNWWKKYEWRKTLGENCWVALFALHYAKQAADPVEKQKALDLATAIGKWAASLPHLKGGVVMGAVGTDYAWTFSVENNLDYYAITRELAVMAESASDRQFFATEAANNKNWFKTEAYDPAQGLFRTGGQADYGANNIFWGSGTSLDVNSWAISALGPEVLQNEFGIDLNEFARKIGERFAVQENGDFAGALTEAKGFDFADAANASSVRRRGIKWVEGTQEMVLAYKILARFYRASSAAASSYYEYLAGLFSMRNSDNATVGAAGVLYAYSDAEGAQIYNYSFTLKTPRGWRDPGTTAWVDLAGLEINPFSVV